MAARLCATTWPGGAGTGPELFARAMGYEVASRESIKELALADFVARRDELAASAPVPEGYRVITFDTVCPEEHLASFGRLLGMLMSEVPLGELDLQAGSTSRRARPPGRLDLQASSTSRQDRPPGELGHQAGPTPVV